VFSRFWLIPIEAVSWPGFIPAFLLLPLRRDEEVPVAS